MNKNWNIIGHEWAVEMLKKHVASGTARHAYLFAGPPGLGRRSLALRFAQALNCQTSLEPGIPCGQCRDCRQIEAMQHADLHVIQAVGEDGNSKLGGILKVDQIRDVRRFLTYKPYQSNYRVALFLRFQEANESAANALLKTLEEAPSYAVLILTADSPEQLLPTIVSRCEVLRLRPLKIEEVRQALEDKGFEANQSKWVAHISGGRYGAARQLIGSEELSIEREERLDELHNLISGSRVQKFAYAEKLAKDRDAMRQTILIWLTYWRDVMLRTAQADTPLINMDRNMEIEDLASRMNLSTARLTVRGLESALEKMDANVNPRLLAEVMLLDLPKL